MAIFNSYVTHYQRVVSVHLARVAAVFNLFHMAAVQATQNGVSLDETLEYE